MNYPETNNFALPTIHSFSIEAAGPIVQCGVTPYFAAVSAIWPVANTAIFIPFTLGRAFTATRMFVYNGAAVNGNLDIGIYTEAGIRVVSSGAVAQAGVNILQDVDITDTTLQPGKYYMALSFDGIVATTLRWANGVMFGVMGGIAEMAAAHPLPAAATLATAANNYIPKMGLSNRSFL